MTATTIPTVTRPDESHAPGRMVSPVSFVLLAFALSWAVWLPAIVLLGEPGQWVAIRWYALAAAIPVGFVAVQTVGAALLGVPVAYGELPVRLLGFVLTGAVVLFLGGGQEEPGWRGWLQPALRQRLTPLAASGIVGAVWAVWHLPLFVLGLSFYADLSFALYLPTLVGLSVIATVLLNRTGGSVAVVMVFHAAVNASGGLLPVDDATSAWLQLASQAVLTGCALALAAVLVRRHGVELGGPLPVPHGVPTGHPAATDANLR